MIDLNQFMRRVQADKLYVKKEELDELLKGSMQSVTYAELKALRDNGQLVAGRQYRITDYVTTTSQENTRSAGHPFDIIVTADSESVLNENARAIQHEENVEIWTGTFKPEVIDGDKALVEGAVTKYFDIYEDFGEDKNTDYKAGDIFVEYGYAENNLGVTVPVLYKTDVEMMEEGADYADIFFYVGRYEHNGETYDRWRKIEHNDGEGLTWDSTGKVYALTNIIVDRTVSETSIVDTYFENANLSAWELKYCLDNDKTRFFWAEEGKQGIVNLQTYESDGKALTRQPSFDGQEESLANEGYIYAWGTQADVNDTDATSFWYSKNPRLTNGEIVKHWDRGTATAEVVDLGIYTDDEEWFICTGTLEHEGVTYYKWECLNKNWVANSGYAERYLLSKTEAPNVDEGSYHLALDTNGDVLEFEEDYSTVLQVALGGKGVVYYMKDEWDNECPYDFKNIQFVRTADWFAEHEDWCNSVLGYVPDEDMWFYTFTWVDENNNVQDLIPIGNTLRNDEGFISGVFANKMGLTATYDIYIEGGENSVLALSNNIIVNSFFYYDNNGAYYGCSSNTFGNGCHSIVFGNSCSNNTFGDSCYNNTFGNECHSNTFGNYCSDNTFGYSCSTNTFDSYCSSIVFGSGCFSNTFGYSCSSIVFGDSCSDNTFGDSCGSNIFGNNCSSNIFGNSCSSNTFGNGCGSNIFGNNCSDNTFGNNCRENIFGNSCSSNTFGNGCGSNIFGNNCYFNTFGEDASNSGEILDFCRRIIFESGVSYVNLVSSTGNFNNVLQNIKVCLGVHGSSSTNPLLINVLRKLEHETKFVAAGSTTTEVEVE